MDSKERHELKENELAEFFTNFSQWWSRHGNTTMIAVVVVAAVYLGYSFYINSTQRSHDDAWYDLATSTSPAAFSEVGQAHNITAVRAMAWLRAADLYLQEGWQPNTSDTPDPLAADPQQILDQAEAMYQRVLDDADRDVFRLNAHMGMAGVAESRQNWEAAQGHYEQVIALSEQADMANFGALAQMRISLLPQLQAPMDFAPEAAPPSDEPADEKKPVATPEELDAPGTDSP